MPAEAGIVERAVDFEKGCYIGQEPVARLHYRGRPNRVLRGLALSAPAEAGAALTLGEKEVGRSARPASPPPSARSRWRSSGARRTPATRSRSMGAPRPRSLSCRSGAGNGPFG